MNRLYEFADFSSATAYKPATARKSSAISKLQSNFSSSNDSSVIISKALKEDPAPKKVYKPPEKVLADLRAKTTSSYSALKKVTFEDKGILVVKKPSPSPAEEESRRERIVDPAKESDDDAEVERVQTKLSVSPATSPSSLPKLQNQSDEKNSKKNHSNKNRSILKKKTIPVTVAPASPRPKGWGFGKAKHFVRPDKACEANQRAATQIQRVVRGGMQRLRYRIRSMERALETREERTRADIAAMHSEFDKRRDAFHDAIEKEQRAANRKVDQYSSTALEAQKIIAYLRKENRKLREKNDEIAGLCRGLDEQNARLEKANESTANAIASLREHTKKIEATHAKLREVVPMYEQSIEQLQDAVDVRGAYCLAEHKIKIMYAKLMGDVLEKFQQQNPNYKPLDRHLETEVTELCLEVDQHQVPMPKSLQKYVRNHHNHNDSCTSFGSSFSSSLGSSISSGLSLVDSDDSDESESLST